jgi:membrane-associated phospholipid phosphatase
LGWALHVLLEASNGLYLALNSLSGSWPMDSFIALAIDNSLVKAGPVAAAFVFVWQAGSKEARQRSRRVLLVTIPSLLLVLLSTKAVADTVFLPRPFIQSQQAYHLEGERLVESPRLAYRVPQEGFSHGRFERLKQGEIEENDLASFPSDHAAFFFALSLGIFLASRRVGLVALAWTLIVICGARIISGTHSPLDIVAGLSIGGAILLALQFMASRWLAGPLNVAGQWTFRYPALASAGLFLILFEVANTLENTREVLRTAAGAGQRLAGL